MQIGIDSFAAAYDDVSLAVSPADWVRDLVEQVQHADQVGLDVFGIGEHHRKDYLDSAPAMILAGSTLGPCRIHYRYGSASVARLNRSFARVRLGFR